MTPATTAVVKLSLGEGSSVTFCVGDITTQTTDAIVNAANSSLMGGGGVDGAIHRAGGPAILDECKKIVGASGPLPPGRAVPTTGGRLKAAYVIHTVGPIWHGGDKLEAEVLASCYRECILLADKLQLLNIAFPSISTGAYGYPVRLAAGVAIRTVAEELPRARRLREVLFMLFDQHTHEAYAGALDEFVAAALQGHRYKIDRVRLDAET